MPGEFVTIKIQSDALRDTLRGLPGALAKGMAAAAQRAGQRFLTFHRRERLSADTVSSSGPLAGTGAARKAGQGPGKGFVGRRVFNVTGNTIETSTLNIRMSSAPATLFERGGEQVNKKYFPVPMPAAKDARGKVASWARKLLRDSRRAREAAGAGFNLFRGRRQVRGLILVRAKSGKRYLAKLNPRQKGRDRLTLLFHLEPRVRVKPRLEFLSSWRRFQPKAIEIYRQALPFAIKAAARKLGQQVTLPAGVVV